MSSLRSLALQMIESVGILHSCGYCHLDISPENFLMCHNNTTLKLIDFGASRKLLQRNDDLYPPPKRSEDRPGKDSYRAPEIHNKQLFNGLKADVWSLGVVLFTNLWQWDCSNAEPNRADKLGHAANVNVNVNVDVDVDVDVDESAASGVQVETNSFSRYVCGHKQRSRQKIWAH
ncbi:hypothetical protein RFI_14820 [Reticulomyxa filosa]|uniref:Protein kinase domain-containing protein n=1 Tax=Reticulomyxa filosa TaxID=46433 RepID=X6N7Z5_RETFI|nr:hypothetical protein RFI_14820 [Reticulomyxa filosa]|eukprot:ETO22380.1 hypothetical protein RFI_14820 [Reticulomyxa filosa]